MDNMNRFGKPSGEPAGEAPAAGPAAPARASGRVVIDIDDILIGRRFQHFEVRARLGRTAAGTVYLADDTSLCQPVMLTMLRRSSGGADPGLVDALAAPRHQSRVAHQNVAQVRFVGTADGNPFVVTEHVDGRSLREEIKHSGAISWIDAVAHMVQIVRALEAAHEVGLVHGALTPSNIILRRRGPDGSAPVDVKVDGFGVAPTADSRDGDDPYLAPEQRAGGAPSLRGDMYALGVIFHEMLTAAPPRSERPLPERLAPQYIRRLVAFLKREDPKQRPSGYEELLGRLEVALVEPPAAQPLAARAGAFVIDMLTLGLVVIAAAVLGPRMAPVSRWEAMQLGLLGFTIYSVCAHKRGGQTLGKQIFGVTLFEPRQGLGWPGMIARPLVQLWGLFAAAAMIDLELGSNPAWEQIADQLGGPLIVVGVLWLLGFLVVLTNKEAIALHDHVTGTSVAAN
ncbi:MAG TPA: protein kinase [Polyangia bacterium]|nr:protein kinase [Polyangia bacterium]